MRQITFDMVVARTKAGGIGLRGQLPWKLPSDMQMFKKITSSGTHGNTVIMGRKTYESIGKPLPNRLNIVLSRQSSLTESDSLKQARSLRDALELSKSVQPEGKIFVIGGGKVYEEGLADCRYVYETLVAN